MDQIRNRQIENPSKQFLQNQDPDNGFVLASRSHEYKPANYLTA